MPLSIFGFQAMWSPVMIGVIVFLTILYFLITVKWRNDFKVSEPLKMKEAVYFLVGIVLLYIVKGSPVDLMAHIMFSFHMVQMALLLLLIPPLLMKGIPWWVWKVVIELPVVRKVFPVLTKPLLSLIVFSGLFSFYHIPLFFDYIKLDEGLHGTYTFILFLSALFMWWSIIEIKGITGRLHGLKKIGFIIGSAVLITPACALIIFTGTPLYDTYTNSESWLKAMELCVPASTLAGLSLSGPELFSNMTPIADQQLGGILMKIVQEIIYAVFLMSIFFKWYKNEQDNAEEITQKALDDLKVQARL
ncbi:MULTISPECIES: cytochrome c oxidase assembly factor CtaG [Psychrobacillus]|jgi:putative membrane protein|uniref:cytochrome c oxidase assembly factor CtaG n=1 Tax=Psychrobacillus TaxID=1221880 RepID=UPI0008E7984A|nr:cytochrome c oxidase assembly factor CtaG [Psychrobacillus psychrodurans]MCZ8539411.1 cytochrome c oxidase assembly factor CtaG [Psychrobacillus psychrodurans]SFM38308.1 putative membrane protein [Psychrobacillus psychrodurans]